METIAQRRRILASAALLGLTTALLLAPAPADASRPPSDPIVVIQQPAPALAPVQGTQAASVRAALEDLRSVGSGSSGC